MTPLGRVITEIQRDAADTPTQDLRSDIQVGLEVLDAAIVQLHALRPGADVIERFSANAEVMETVITIALYVRELATRPVDLIPPVPISSNYGKRRARRSAISSGPAQRASSGDPIARSRSFSTNPLDRRRFRHAQV